MKPFEPNYRFHTDAEITWILAQDVEYDAYLTKLLDCAHPILAAHDEVVRKMADVVAYMKTPDWDFNRWVYLKARVGLVSKKLAEKERMNAGLRPTS